MIRHSYSRVNGHLLTTGMDPYPLKKDRHLYKILIIEGDNFSSKTFEAIVHTLGFTSLLSFCRQTSQKIIVENPSLNLVLLDLDLIKYDAGFLDDIKNFKRFHKNRVPIIGLSIEDIWEGWDEGITDILVKPVSVQMVE